MLQTSLASHHQVLEVMLSCYPCIKMLSQVSKLVQSKGQLTNVSLVLWNLKSIKMAIMPLLERLAFSKKRGWKHNQICHRNALWDTVGYCHFNSCPSGLFQNQSETLAIMVCMQAYFRVVFRSARRSTRNLRPPTWPFICSNNRDDKGIKAARKSRSVR